MYYYRIKSIFLNTTFIYYFKLIVILINNNARVKVLCQCSLIKITHALWNNIFHTRDGAFNNGVGLVHYMHHRWHLLHELLKPDNFLIYLQLFHSKPDIYIIYFHALFSNRSISLIRINLILFNILDEVW